MVVTGEQQRTEIVPEASPAEVVERFLASVRAGKDWFEALLETIASWTAPEEVHEGRRFRYLIGNEAFDWLVLAERLATRADGLIPDHERATLLFKGVCPRPMTEEEFKERVGPAKYRGVVNYWYGVRVEEALIMAVEAEVRKQRRGLRPEEPNLDETVFERIYALPRAQLLAKFFEELAQPSRDTMTLTELKEFTYWLFKYRLKNSDQARLASDTKKGLDMLERLGLPSRLGSGPEPEAPQKPTMRIAGSRGRS